MATEDINPTKFLFGKIFEEKIDPEHLQHVPLKYTQEKVLYVLIPVIHMILINVGIFAIFNYPEYQVIIGSGLVAALFILTISKNIFLMKHFAPDLYSKVNNHTKFLAMQSFLSYLLFGAIYAGLGLLFLFTSGFQVNIPLLVVMMIMMLLIYSKGIADIGLISLGLGIGIIPHLLTPKSVIGNIRQMLRLLNAETTKLGIVRFVFISGNTGLYYFSRELIYMLPLSVIVIWYAINHERINMIKIRLKIRGYLTTINPAIIPEEDGPIESRIPPFSLSKNSPVDKVDLRAELEFMAYPDPMIGQENPEQIVINSIGKIIDEVKHKPLSKKGIIRTCPDCKVQVLNNGRFCHQCGEEVYS